MGVNAGYRLDLSDNDWRYDDALDIGFPDLDLSSFQFAFVVGYEFDPKRYSDYIEKQKKKFKKG